MNIRFFCKNEGCWNPKTVGDYCLSCMSKEEEE